MSGIEEMQNKIKSKKMTLDDLPSPILRSSINKSEKILEDRGAVDNETVEYVNTAKQQSSKLLKRETVHTDVQHANAVLQKSSNAAAQYAVDTVKQQANAPATSPKALGATAQFLESHFHDRAAVIQQNSNTALQQSVNPEIQQHSAAGEPVSPPRMKKVTYYLTEEMYKAFNDVYAKRMLEGRTTDKSTLISEAVELLYRGEMAR